MVHSGSVVELLIPSIVAANRCQLSTLVQVMTPRRNSPAALCDQRVNSAQSLSVLASDTSNRRIQNHLTLSRSLRNREDGGGRIHKSKTGGNTIMKTQISIIKSIAI